MSDASRDPGLPRAFRGEAKQDPPILELGPFAPWQARVTVVPLHLRRSVTFQVIAEWTGPPAPYMPPDDRPGGRQDIYTTADVQLAKAVAQHAAEAFRAVRVPDLREAAKQLQQRLAAGPYG